MKSYTDIEQSKKLAQILPLESADMLFGLGEDKYADSIRVPLTKKHWEQMMMPDINPCWSLVALLNVLPRPSLHQTKSGKWYCDAEPNRLYFSEHHDNPIDACYEMILKLHE